MSSLIKQGDGLRRIDVIVRGRRYKIRLGRMTEAQARAVQVRVDALELAAKAGTRNPDAERWCQGLSAKIRDRLTKLGLLPARTDETLQGLVDRFKASRAHVKPVTHAADKQAMDSLIAWFTPTRQVRTIAPMDAAEWRIELERQGLAGATIAKRVIKAKALFAQAVTWKLADENPFSALRAGSQKNPSRLRFVDVATSLKVLDACPSKEWRGIFVLARWGGVRIPSEIQNLKWSDVLWDAGKFRVLSPKTEHHEGKAERWVPLFPEVRDALMAMFEVAPVGEDFVFPPNRRRSSNLREKMERIIRKAGVEQWPRIFHNLRATRQTELSERFPMFAVCRWLGNSPQVADDHYLSVTDDLMEKAAQKAAQHGSEQSGIEGPNPNTKNSNAANLPDFGQFGGELMLGGWAVRDSNTLRKYLKNLLLRHGCGAQSGALANAIVDRLVGLATSEEKTT